MAKTTVYKMFEVHEGFGRQTGRLDLATISRADADARLEELWAKGQCVQLFGITSEGAERVLLRSLVGLTAA